MAYTIASQRHDHNEQFGGVMVIFGGLALVCVASVIALYSIGRDPGHAYRRHFEEDV